METACDNIRNSPADSYHAVLHSSCLHQALVWVEFARASQLKEKENPY